MTSEFFYWERGVKSINNYTVYLDLVLLGNLLIDGLLLWSTARVLDCRIGPWRLLLGALCGAGYAVLVAWMQAAWLTAWPVKAAVAGIMLSITFLTINWHYLLRALLIFYGIALLLGGAVCSLLLSGNCFLLVGLDDGRQLLALLSLLAAVSLIVVPCFSFLPGLWRRRLQRREHLFTLAVNNNQCSVSCRALLDSGNQLTEPLTGIPVIIAEKRAVERLFPQAVLECLKSNSQDDCFQLLQKIEDDEWRKRFTVVPFSALGRERGYLLAFRPEEITVISADNSWSSKQSLIGLAEQNLSADNSYQALLHQRYVS